MLRLALVCVCMRLYVHDQCDCNEPVSEHHIVVMDSVNCGDNWPTCANSRVNNWLSVRCFPPCWVQTL